MGFIKETYGKLRISYNHMIFRISFKSSLYQKTIRSFSWEFVTFSLREILFKVNEVSCERRVVVKHESFLFKKRCYWLPLQRRRSWHVSGSNHQRFSIKKVFLKVSQKSQKNTRAGVSFFNKIAGVSPATLLKRDSSTGYFLQKFLRTLFLPNISEWLVLYFTSWGTDRLYNVMMMMMMMMMMMISWYSRVKKK